MKGLTMACVKLERSLHVLGLSYLRLYFLKVSKLKLRTWHDEHNNEMQIAPFAYCDIYCFLFLVRVFGIG